jgi:glycosyltransferase involved in cell wall biosynthesis
MLHIITRLVRGGADENTFFTCRGLDKRRYVVDLAVGAGAEIEAFGDPEDITLHRIPELVRDPHPIKDLIALVRLAGVIRRGRYQIVHTHTAKAGFLGRVAAALAGTPIVIHTVHGVTFHDHLPAPLRLFYLLLERVAGRFTHQFVTVGEDVRRIYESSGIGRGVPYETIYSGMPLDDYLKAGEMAPEARERIRASFGFGPGHVVAAMAAQLEARKGHVYLFESVARLRQRYPELRVLLLGHGELRESLEWQCRARGIDDIVVFAGHREDLPGVLAACDISVLTSLWEGLPRVLVQSAAAGRPIVTFDVEGAWEVVREGRNGFIVPSRDVDALTERLETLVRDRAAAGAMGAEGPAMVGEVWTVETMVDRLDQMYQKLVFRKAG